LTLTGQNSSFFEIAQNCELFTFSKANFTKELAHYSRLYCEIAEQA